MAIRLTSASLQWADSELSDIKLDFDEVNFTISQLNGYALTVRAIGYVSFRLDGVWSDLFISTGEILDSDPLIASSAEFAASQAERESGNLYRDRAEYRLLRLVLESGGVLECVAHDFLGEPSSV